MDAERWEELLINYQNDPDQLVFYWSGSFWWFCWLLTGTKARWITHHRHCRQVLTHTLFHRQLINTDRGRGRTKDILLRLTRPPDLTAPPTPPSWQRIIARQRPETRNTFNQHTHTILWWPHFLLAHTDSYLGPSGSGGRSRTRTG